MRQVTVQFFAAFREAAGTASEQVATDADSVGELFVEMTQRFQGLEREPAALVAINDEMSEWGAQFAEGDVILFFPPVAGG